MKKDLKEWLLAICIGLVIPGIIFYVTDKLYLMRAHEQTNTTQVVETGTIGRVFGSTFNPIMVLQSDGTIEQMDLDVYLTGVVLGEMPVDFDIEALKAQAVVARTYTLKRSTSGKKHEQGAVCKESSCCQAYRSPSDFLQKGGTQAALDKVKAAVSGTSGWVLYYDGALIEATYFSCSGGRTEDALAVWGSDIPYLRAVDSPGEEDAAYYTDSVVFTSEEFIHLLNIEPRGSVTEWFGKVEYTDGGGVLTMQIADESFEGTYLREKLGLRSTAFTMTVIDGSIHITTKGFGHRVGMSQYGAEAMAVKGSSYQEILSHYYPGTELAIYSNN